MFVLLLVKLVVFKPALFVSNSYCKFVVSVFVFVALFVLSLR